MQNNKPVNELTTKQHEQQKQQIHPFFGRQFMRLFIQTMQKK